MTTQSPIEDEPVIENLGEPRKIILRRYIIIGAAILVFCGGLYFQINHGSTETADTDRKRNLVTVSSRPIETPPPAPPVEVEYVVYDEPEYVEPEYIEPPVYVPPPAPQNTYVPPLAPPKPKKVGWGRSTGVTVISAASSASASPQGGSIQPVASNGQGGPIGQSTASSNLPDDVERVYAGQLDNLDSMILQNTPIPCVLQNDINTQLPGKVSCVVSRDIWSADNSRILLAQGSRANGEYQSGTTSGAVTMIGVVWGRMKNTENMVANLDSPAAGPQGAAGIEPDYVNYHFWKKFSAAFAVSMIDGALRNVGANDGNSQVVVNSATNTGSDILSQILQSTINIPATRKAHRGAELIIFLNKDISFERVL